MENNEIMNDIIEETMTETTGNQACSGKDFGTGVATGVGVAAAAYGIYKLVDFLIKKHRIKKEQKALEAEAIEVSEKDIEVK